MNSKIMAVAMCFLSAGCYPMEQAPLVYASKNQFGVTVAAGTPDSPGLDVNIGFKALDSAFVPVAVAKRCAKTGQCDARLHEVQVITGQNNITGKSQASERQIDELEKSIETAKLERNAKQTELAGVNDLIDQMKSKKDKEAELEALKNPAHDPVTDGPRVLSENDKGRKTVLITELASLNALDIIVLNARSKTLSGEIETANQRIDAALADRKRLIEEKHLSSGDAKQDALSLYGSFNGSAGGKSDGATLGLGKVFATGVAAQQMAQGVKDSTNPANKAVCMQMGEKMVALADAADKPKLVVSVLKGCGLQLSESATK
ncbi:hypothetical protein ASE85_11480 [Sphingobium sp. Leaf26]|uniref:hypothetical protein n=1 Tax=Sphingobium sp. Leaf26 TaxID=1735693 RepID=UPI0006FD9073|nr:hypothetical protein [Sphingobium sp. Leaf26]KQM99310.1 hypothetical protein ASE85_11480 [Sphingobium sp. Leaf26]